MAALKNRELLRSQMTQGEARSVGWKMRASLEGTDDLRQTKNTRVPRERERETDRERHNRTLPL